MEWCILKGALRPIMTTDLFPFFLMYPCVAARTPRKTRLLLPPPPILSANCASPSPLARHGGTGMQTALIMTFTVCSLLSGGSPVLRRRNAERRLNRGASEATRPARTVHVRPADVFALYIQPCMGETCV